ncbi:MAG: DUF3854 domain-containing protein [Nitrospira sp.]|nr:DUF3854 domain-containing protein [Nitrospira sp.]
MNSLAPEHLADLQKSNLNSTTNELCQFYSARPHDIKQFQGIDSALVIPYFGLDGKLTGHKRLRFFPPRLTKEGKEQKYSQDHGSDSEIYIPPLVPWAQIAADPTQPLTITEGEKKAAAACQAGLFCIVVAGVWNWRQRLDNHERMVLSAFDQFIWQDRRVELIPDSDVWKKEKFQALCGFYALAMELVDRGASVTFVRLPESGK